MYYFIVNPNADCGWGEYVWKKTKAQLEAGGVEYEAYLTEVPGDARAYAEALTKGRRDPIIIAVVGGDGTMNEVLKASSAAQPVSAKDSAPQVPPASGLRRGHLRGRCGASQALHDQLRHRAGCGRLP